MTEKRGRGAAPGENRFRKCQQNQVKATCEEISVVIEQFRKSRLSFRNITHLASYLADVITEKRGEGASRRMAPSTLLRTTAYRIKLEGYLAASGSKSNDDKFSRLVTDLERKELDRLRVENIRLKQFIEKHLNGSHELSSTMPVSDSTQVVDQLSRTISLLLEASNGQVVIDQEAGEIVNGWARSKKNRIIVPAGIAKPYLEWQNSFPNLGGNKGAA